MNLLSGAAFAVFFLALTASFAGYEALVKRQYAVARDLWEAEGRPPGFVWDVRGTSVMRSGKRGEAYLRWLLSNPAWIASDPAAAKAQKAMRASWLVGAAAWVAIIVAQTALP